MSGPIFWFGWGVRPDFFIGLRSFEWLIDGIVPFSNVLALLTHLCGLLGEIESLLIFLLSWQVIKVPRIVSGNVCNCSCNRLSFPCLSPFVIMICLANSKDPDQLASSEASWSGSTLFVIDREKVWFQSNQFASFRIRYSDVYCFSTREMEKMHKIWQCE